MSDNKSQMKSVEGMIRDINPLLIRVAYAQGFRDEHCEDLVQSVWLSYLQSPEQFKGKSQLSTYLVGILRIKILERRRQNSKEPSESVEELLKAKKELFSQGAWIEAPLSPQEFLEKAEKQRTFEECFEQLPETHKMIIYLREFEEYTTEKVCEMLKVTRSNLGVLLYRAKNLLRQCVEGK